MVSGTREGLKRLVNRVFPADSSTNGNGHAVRPAEEPLRSELFSVPQLERHGKALAALHEAGHVRGPDRLLPRLADNEALLRDAYALLADAVTDGRRVTPAAEWFLDNYHLVEDQIRTARRHLPRRYSKELPRLIAGPSAGYPRVYDLALELISHVDGHVDLEGLTAFVAAYQSVRLLKLGELWAIPIMLRLALLENLRRVVVRVARGRREREEAIQWIERMTDVAEREPGNVVLIVAEMVRKGPPLTNAFVSEFASRLQGQGPAFVFAMTWLEQRLAERGHSLERVFQQASQDQAADQVSIGNSINSLRLLGATDWRQFVEKMSAVEQTLRTDPDGVYAAMDFGSRDQYRHAVEEIARRSPLTEEEVASAAIEMTGKRHVGYLLIDDGRPDLEARVKMRRGVWLRLTRLARRHRLSLYLTCIALITLVVTGLVLWRAHHAGLGAMGLAAAGVAVALCASQLAVALTHWGAPLLIRPRMLPRLEFLAGIPPEQKTIVAVPAMLTDAEEIDELIEALEVRHLANRDKNLLFALLTDFRDAPAENMPDDDALVRQVIEGIERLNEKHPGGQFLLFHRKRKWNQAEGVWMGWERKRGKLEEFNATLRGQDGKFDTVVGPVERLHGVQYVITLDSDTQLPRDSARQLIGTMAHPLNRPVFDSKLGRVTRGYSILQPRVGISLSSSGRSRFARLFAGDAGVDPYTRIVSDLYQDVFEEGSFIGKGIYDLEAFDESLRGKFPENRILSHDLLEGAHARAGLVSDVVLFEEFPAAYPVDVSRRYRWIRGDWQITPWLLPRVPGADARQVRNTVSALSRWKILDNMRRSLVPVALLALVVMGWFLPGGARFYMTVVVGIVLLPAVLAAAVQAASRPRDVPPWSHFMSVAESMGCEILREAFAIACLPYDAYLSIDAIVRTAYRMLVSGRKLLEWRTARDAARGATTSLAGFLTSMWVLPLAAVLGGLAVMHWNRSAMPAAAPFLILWLCCPTIAWWVSRPVQAIAPKLDQRDMEFLGVLARQTWRFFETFVVAADNFLPPDNFQEDPPVGIAHRTSPTNIGLYLLSILAAHDFGYASVGEAIERIKQTLATLDRMQRWRGHFYNWIDTKTLESLRPLYISSVDSGNLAGHLLVLASGLEELIRQPVLPSRVTGGLRDMVGVVREIADKRRAGSDIIGRVGRIGEILRTPPKTLSALYLLLGRVTVAAAELAGSATDPELVASIRELESQSRRMGDELVRLAPWVALDIPNHSEQALQAGKLRQIFRKLDELPSLLQLAELGEVPQQELAGFERLSSAVAEGAKVAGDRINELRELALRLREMADLDYEFLYDKDRRLLSIGYNVGEHRLDPSFYDLLASEARLTSFTAIAQGKLPQEHWFSLGRLLTTTGGHRVLLSWSGSMFEYLMPLLVMPTIDRTLLDETCRAAVARQIRYGKERGVPWGISESCYNKTDAQQNYQYRAFGVPGLGFKRGLADDLVIAPYATVMALMVDPEHACKNLHQMRALGLMNQYGVYEAADYTPSRLQRGQTSVIIKSFMAHHQGMSLLSMAYVLLDRPMQKRFATDPAFAATDLLLQERVPRAAPIFPHPAETSEARQPAAETEMTFRVFDTPHSPSPEVHLLSNGRYHIAVTSAGGGYSRWRDLAITRWQEDPTRDCWGQFCYLRDVGSGEFWSAAHHPTLRRGDTYEAVFSQGKAEFRRRDGGIDTYTEVAVSPEDDIELRRLTITNRGRMARTIELTTYAEVVIAPPAADAAHPAFSNLFVQTQLVRPRNAILCTRRPRSAGERPPWMLHLMTAYGTTAGETSFESSRAEFIGRGSSVADPAAMHRRKLADSEGSVLDPIVAIRQTLVIGPDETVRFHVVTGVAETREGAMGLIEKYHDRRLADRVFELAFTHSQVVLRQLDATEADTQLYGRLAGSVLYANPQLRAAGSVISRNRRGQPGLWGYGISGDLPIILVRIGDQAQINLVRQLVQAHAYWRTKGLAADLVIWNEDQSGYRQALQEMILGVVAARAEQGLVDKPGGIFVRRIEQISEEDKVLMQSVARAIISDNAGTLLDQLDRRQRAELTVPRFRPIRSRKPEIPVGVELQRRDLVSFNGIGGFTQDGREYIITTTAESPTPAPWANVLANKNVGAVVTESTTGYTWCENAQAFRLTPWHNDPVTDLCGEAFYLRDEESGRYWSPSPLPARGGMPYTSRHGFGYTTFEYTEGGISTELWLYVGVEAPVKFFFFKMRNTSDRPRRVSVTSYFEMVLGDRRPQNVPFVVTEVDPRTGAMFARNNYHIDFGDRVVFLDSSEAQHTVTGDRTEFIGRNGSLARPAAMVRSRLSGRVGAGMDPCAAMQAMIDLAPGQERELSFTLGCGKDVNEARSLVMRFRGTANAYRELEAVWGHWNRLLGAVYVKTPDASVNFLANGWLMYQVLASRFWGRSGFYQSGGAFGFRDQLQDTMSMIHAQPGLFREHLLRCASRQFREGDVQHWWHPPQGRGVRTRISDDYLWLPYATCRYVATIGDTGVLDEKANYLEGRAVNADEESYYDVPVRSDEQGTLYDHCVRAIKHGLRFGEHGLPLMGCGDWNDGMNLVGMHEKGESVWLGFFLYEVLNQFGALATRRDDAEFAETCKTEAVKLRQNIADHGWDGQWYRRAYFDNGEPLGSASNPECKIDSLPQAWSVLSGGGDAMRSRQAMEEVNKQLVRRETRLIQLLDPPFDRSELNPGYIKGYVPGVRENGGQYTHAAVWTVMAAAASGDRELAWELFRLIDPVRHGGTAESIGKYKVEPYVLAADVYFNAQHAGRGGWTWYTGSAGWMYRLITESLLGLKLEVDHLRMTPLLPKEWTDLEIHYRYRETFHHIRIHNKAGRKVVKVTVDGAEQGDLRIPLIDDRREHGVEVWVE